MFLKTICIHHIFINGDTLMMKFDDKKFIAERIKYHRKKMNLTQSELAEMADLSDQHLSRIERGCYIPSLPTFFLLVKILKIDLREFGFDRMETNNPVKDQLIDIVNNADDNELVFLNDVVIALENALVKIRKNIHNRYFM